MRRLPAEVLDDPSYPVPVAQPAPDGLAWLRANVPRFTEGEPHARLRRLLEAELAALDVQPRAGEAPIEAMLRAIGTDVALAPVVLTVAAAYQPHARAT